MQNQNEDIYVHPFGEKRRSFDARSGITTDNTRGVLNQGITLRDHFAGLAMQGLATLEGYTGAMWIAKDAYDLADAMLKERAKTNSPSM